ncbi:MAG TPA: Mur ligase family protein [Candidatus Dormibacteraeota bacterium]
MSRPRSAETPPAEQVRQVELRVLDGPNLYFPCPAVKLTVSVPGWLNASEDRTERLANRAGLSSVAKPGAVGSEQRRRYVARLAGQLTRVLARATKTQLAVRARPGAEADEIVVAFPWRRRRAAEAFAAELPGLMLLSLDGRRSLEHAVEEIAERLKGVEPGPAPTVLSPTVPVIAVTGTNGKTTTVRLTAHLAREAGWRVACTTTDGVYHNETLIEDGDYSGFAGAARALGTTGLQLAVLETARGGILLRGIGTSHNDVAVVTNISEDHLDQYGIRTLDQLAEVKASITRITKPDGWDVLNADDPRVLAMRRQATGRTWIFSLDVDHPAVRSTLDDRGRVTTVLDGSLVVMSSRRDVHALLPVEDIPVTLAGISSHNLRNAMAATSAALAVGVPEEGIVKGLRSFILEPERNPGRANLFELEGKIIVVDYAHNEDGMIGLIEICRGLRAPGARIWLTFGIAGDRTNAIVHRLGYTAARGADRVAVAELRRYLRGRDPKDLVERLQAGVVDGGHPVPPAFADEMTALKWMVAEGSDRDVLAITALAQRPEIFAYMKEHGAISLGPDRVKALVRRSRDR